MRTLIGSCFTLAGHEGKRDDITCGEEYFQHEFSVDPSLMTKWRSRIKSESLETLFAETIQTGLKTKALMRPSLQRINVDTTVQEKAVAFPTDTKLYHRMRINLAWEAKFCGVLLRQPYTRKSKQFFVMQSRYAHARQMKNDGRLGRNYLLGQEGDRINTILSGAGTI